MQLDIILLAWKDPQDALEQIERVQTWEIAKQITLVHNESEGFQIAPACNYIPLAENRGYAGGINAGLQTIDTSKPHAILLLNNDASITEDDVTRLLRHLETDDSIGLIGPVLAEGNQPSYGGRNPLWYTRTRIHQKPRTQNLLLDVDYVPGTALLMRTAVFDSIGLLDDRYFFSGEIAAYCQRAQASGWRCVVASDAIAKHDAADNEGLRTTLYRYYTLRNRFLMANQTNKGWQRIIGKAYWTSIGLLMWLRVAWQDRSAARAISLALRDGWQKRFGNRNELFHV